MIKTSVGRIFFIALIFTSACSTFIRDEDSGTLLLKYQAGEFVLLQNISRNEEILPANSIVKLIVVPGDEWVKIYAYDSSEELLVSKRVLLLYLFQSDFPDEKFSQEFLDAELLKLVKPKISGAKAEKKVIKKETKSKKIKG